MRRLLLIAALLLPVRAAAEAGLTGAATLRRPLAARPVGMADAFTAMQGGLSSVGHNPAALAKLEKPDLLSTYNRGAAEDSFAFLGYAHPLSKLVVFGGLVYYDGGHFDVALSNGVRERRKAQQDFVGQAGAALPLGGGLSAGAQAKVMRLELAGEATAQGAAVDGGLHWRTPLKGLALGASLLNVGPEVKYESEGDPLPLTARAGAAYAFDMTGLNSDNPAAFGFSHFIITADAVKVRDERLAASTGLEMGMDLQDLGFVSLRGGYLFDRDLQSVAFGVGVREGRYTLDYGLGVMKRLTHAHHVTLGIGF